MIELARRYNLLVVCDDVYNLLYFDSPDQDVTSPKRLFAYDNKWVIERASLNSSSCVAMRG